MTKGIYTVRDFDAKLQAMLKKLDEENYKRLPILSEKGTVDGWLYREDILRYLLGFFWDEWSEATVRSLVSQPLDSRKKFASVDETATLAEARDAMRRIQDCKVVFVTRTGGYDGLVLGMITNSYIVAHANLS